MKTFTDVAIKIEVYFEFMYCKLTECVEHEIIKRIQCMYCLQQFLVLLFVQCLHKIILSHYK